jgi:hypothetical protein
LQSIPLLLGHRVLLVDLSSFCSHLDPFSFEFLALLVKQSLFFIK